MSNEQNPEREDATQTEADTLPRQKSASITPRRSGLLLILMLFLLFGVMLTMDYWQGITNSLLSPYLGQPTVVQQQQKMAAEQAALGIEINALVATVAALQAQNAENQQNLTANAALIAQLQSQKRTGSTAFQTLQDIVREIENRLVKLDSTDFISGVNEVDEAQMKLQTQMLMQIQQLDQMFQSLKNVQRTLQAESANLRILLLEEDLEEDMASPMQYLVPLGQILGLLYDAVLNQHDHHPALAVFRQWLDDDMRTQLAQPLQVLQQIEPLDIAEWRYNSLQLWYDVQLDRQGGSIFFTPLLQQPLSLSESVTSAVPDDAWWQGVWSWLKFQLQKLVTVRVAPYTDQDTPNQQYSTDGRHLPEPSLTALPADWLPNAVLWQRLQALQSDDAESRQQQSLLLQQWRDHETLQTAIIDLQKWYLQGVASIYDDFSS